MPIDFDKLASSQITTVPILQGSFKYKGKRYSSEERASGWYDVEITGNNYKVLSPQYVPEEVDLIRGYVFENQFVFQNFNVGKRKTGKEVMTDIHFNTCDSFTSIFARLWEDGQLYYHSPNYTDSFIYSVKEAMDKKEEIRNLKGLTPELRTLCLFHELELQRMEEAKAEQEAEKLRQTLHGRLILSFRRVGAELIKYSTKGNRIIVDWSIGEQEFNSVLDKDTFRVIEAGYCMSGDDRRHNIHSMVVLAKDYDERGKIYKTRDT
jgi:hypothetical protein